MGLAKGRWRGWRFRLHGAWARDRTGCLLPERWSSMAFLIWLLFRSTAHYSWSTASASLLTCSTSLKLDVSWALNIMASRRNTVLLIIVVALSKLLLRNGILGQGEDLGKMNEGINIRSLRLWWIFLEDLEVVIKCNGPFEFFVPLYNRHFFKSDACHNTLSLDRLATSSLILHPVI